jgi:hypothetical protein
MLLAARPSAGQVFEAVGQRALGMGGAFVAVADDGTAAYWNPGGLAAGATVDACLGYATSWRADGGGSGGGPASRTETTAFCLAMPAFAFSYNRLHGTGAGGAMAPTGTSAGDRQDLRPRGAGVSSLDTRQFGATLVQSLLPGLAVGATVKYVRGRAGAGQAAADLDAEGLLDQAADLPGRVSHAFDADVGAMGTVGWFRAGLVVRNLLAPGFETDTGLVLRLHRQARAGVAITPGRDASLHASEDGWIVAVDADLTRTPAADGDRRMVAAGAERWLAGHRVGLRGGVRANTVGAARPVGAAGISVAVKKGVLVEAHVARGGQDADQGWGVGLRVGF